MKLLAIMYATLALGHNPMPTDEQYAKACRDNVAAEYGSDVIYLGDHPVGHHDDLVFARTDFAHEGRRYALRCRFKMDALFQADFERLPDVRNEVPR